MPTIWCRKFRIVTLSVLLTGTWSNLKADTAIPEADGKWNIKCECLRNFNNCHKKFFATAEGKSKHYWHQDAYVKKGIPLDLAEACYRKRDVYNKGEESCCIIPGDEAATIKNLFSASQYRRSVPSTSKP